MWKEDQFRYVIAQELQKGKGKGYWGMIADGSTRAKTKLVLERSYTNKSDRNKVTGKEIDIVSINSDLRRTNKGTVQNPLAVEVKAQKGLGKKKMNEEIKRVRSFLSQSHGERYYDIGVVINGNTITKESELMKSLTTSSAGNNLLVGWLDKNGNPVLMWEKRPELGSKLNPYSTKGDAEKGRKTGTVWFYKFGTQLESMKKATKSKATKSKATKSKATKSKAKRGSKLNPYPTKGDAEKGRKTGMVWFKKYGTQLKSMKKK